MFAQLEEYRLKIQRIALQARQDCQRVALLADGHPIPALSDAVDVLAARVLELHQALAELDETRRDALGG